MGISHYKAIFRRARHDEEPSHGYTKDFLQAPAKVSGAFRRMFHHDFVEGSPKLLQYAWPGGRFEGGRIYLEPSSGRLEVGQWTKEGAPRPWQLGNPGEDPLVTLPGNPLAAIPKEADAQWAQLEPLQPWLMMVQLDYSQEELHLRAYLKAPPFELLEADLEHVPQAIRVYMSGQGGLVDGLPDIWFEANDLRDPWRDSSTDYSSEAGRDGVQPTAQATAIGGTYRVANEKASSVSPEPFTVDPNERDRATRAHAVTQNALAEAVRARGRDPLSPLGEPGFDLAWKEEDRYIVAEVKSINARNEERQLRLGLGQVLRYRQILGTGTSDVHALLVTSSAPSDTRWSTLCSQLGVGLVWPPDLGSKLAEWLSDS